MHITSTNEYMKETLIKTDILLINKEKVFIKYMEVFKKIRSIIKNKINSELVYFKHIWKKPTKGSFDCLYVPVLLTYSIYRKDENCYPKVFLEKILFN